MTPSDDLTARIDALTGRGDSESRAFVLSGVLSSTALPSWPQPSFAS
ncbi:hypothetical protein [Microbacterium sp. 1.5R]|nr:hypothetical protein [Microbacterium sp. 1.5R]